MQPIAIRVALVPVPGGTAAELSSNAINFRRQLLEGPVHNVELVRDSEGPPGAKAVDVISIGELVVTAIPAGAVIAAIASIARAKIQARALNKVVISVEGSTIEITGQNETQQQQIIESWLAHIVGETDGSDGDR